MLYKLAGLTRVHGTATILDIDSLSLEPGRIYSLVGPNGAGKTTLLHLLAFLDSPSTGSLSFQGRKVDYGERRLRELRQRVTLVEQYPILFSGSVRKNVEYGLKLRRMPRKRRHAVVEEVLEMVGMSSFIDADARKLSGGENKRVALARALALEPEVLLCDEPTANVDSENQEIILDILASCNREQKVSLIFATHYLSQANRLADATIVLQNGRLSRAGRENLVAAVYRGRGPEGVLFRLAGGAEIVAAKEWNLEQRDYTLHFPPDQIALEQECEGRKNCCRGTVSAIERVGERVFLTVDCGFVFKVEVALAQYHRRPLRIDDQVGLLLPVNEGSFL